MSPTAADPRPTPPPTVIRKYVNRRLYDTANGRFATLADLHEMVREGRDFVVQEAKTGRDITASILAQIVAEEAGKGNNLQSLGYLRQLLRFYHAGLGDQVSAYLEGSLELFAANQRDLVRQLSNPFDPVRAITTFRTMSERSSEHFARLFTFGGPDSGGAPPPDEPEARRPEPRPVPGGERRGGDDLRSLRAELAALQRRLDALERGD